MSVAKFVAANGREAMRKVREAMGPDAVVLSNRAVEGGVEIVAMRDADLGAVSATAQPYAPSASSASSASMLSMSPMAPLSFDAPAALDVSVRTGPDGTGAVDDDRLDASDGRAGGPARRAGLDAQRWSASSPAWPTRPPAWPLATATRVAVRMARQRRLLGPARARCSPTCRVGTDRPAAMAWIRQELARKVPVLADEDRCSRRAACSR